MKTGMLSEAESMHLTARGVTAAAQFENPEILEIDLPEAASLEEQKTVISQLLVGITQIWDEAMFGISRDDSVVREIGQLVETFFRELHSGKPQPVRTLGRG